MATARFRVVFDDEGILTKTQKKQGLKRSWVMLKPHFYTINDVVSYLIDSFDLHHSCPNGITLSVDGFVLPPFESTAILKEKEILRVKRKGKNLRDVIKRIEGANTFVEDQIVEKQPLPSGIKLLANEEFEKESQGYESETYEDEDEAKENVSVQNTPNDNLPSKKRKASSKMEGRKTKRQRQITPESVEKKSRTPKKKRKHENGTKHDILSNPGVDVKCIKNLEPTSDPKCNEPEGNKAMTTPVSTVPDKPKKVTRSTRRKHLQRSWRKEHKRLKAEMDKQQSDDRLPVKNINTDPGVKEGVSIKITEQQQADEDSDGEGDLVPVVIRPGHIRFTRSGKVKDMQQNQGENVSDAHATRKTSWDVQDNQVAKETFRWNGTTNKRRGQKWGMEKQSNSWKESRNYNAHPSTSWANKKQLPSDAPVEFEKVVPPTDFPKETFRWNGITNKRKGQKWGMEKQPTSWKESRDNNAHPSTSWANEKQRPSDASDDFEKLVPLTDLPKAGDILAYRLLELSSTWTPELSSFRVGKISWFDAEANRIMLVPDPKYPLNLEKKTDDIDDADDSGLPPASSLYNEDGSLEIDFTSLAEVRIVKRGDLIQSQVGETPTANGTPLPAGTSISMDKSTPLPAGTSKSNDGIQNGNMNVASNGSNQELHTPASVNGKKKDVWEEISEALSAKKTELTQESSWNKKDSSTTKRSWSSRTLRSSALGPTMARLRAQNGF